MGRRYLVLIATVIAFAAPRPVAAEEAAVSTQCGYFGSDYGFLVINDACEGFFSAASDDTERADRMFKLAYHLNELDNGAKAAAALLERAAKLDPARSAIWSELAYSLADLGFFREALEPANRAVDLMGDASEAQQAAVLNERSYIRRKLGDFAGAAADLEAKMAIVGENSGDLVSLARDRFWLGQIDEAQAIAKRARQSGPSAGDASDLQALDNEIARSLAFTPRGDPSDECQMRDLSDPKAAARLVDACTAAYLAASSDADRADFLTARAVARTVEEQSDSAGFMDTQVAVGIDPVNPDRWTNYAARLLAVGRSWAARNAYDEALKLYVEKAQGYAVALAGRAQANYNLGDKDAALLDAKESARIWPNSVALWVAGDIARDGGDDANARQFWLGAYKLGSTDDRLIDRLKSVGIDDPNSAKLDQD
jgi:tetratricopeptide (TPR) repeat protein